jgi:type I restriction enzyme S subunit
MAARWTSRSLGELAELRSEQLNPQDSPTQLFQHFSIPAFDERESPLIESGSAIQSQKFVVPKDAILVSKLNPRMPRVWEPIVSSKLPAVASTEFLVLVPRFGVDRRYLKYACLSPTVMSRMQAIASGTSGSHQRVRPGDVLSIEVEVPQTIGEQRAISHVLGSLDDKIEVNRQINETLESVQRALFKSWFVDFDPVRAKADGHATGLSATVSGLFPDSFEQSGIGPIPSGWSAAPIGHIAETTIGGDWGEDASSDGTVEAVCLRGVDLERLRKNGWADAPHRWFSVSSLEKRSLCPKDVLIAGSGAGPTGRSLWSDPTLSNLWGLPVTYSNFCKRFRCKSEAFAIYTDRLLSIMRDSGEIWEYVNGTSVPNLDASALLSRKMVIVPDTAILELFAQLAQKISAVLLSSESRTLASIRDTLLPKLISGEVSVSHHAVKSSEPA